MRHPLSKFSAVLMHAASRPRQALLHCPATLQTALNP